MDRLNDLAKRSLQFAEGLLRAVAPDELGETPIYLVDSRDAPWGDWSDSHGATHTKMDLACRSVVEWRGRGFCTVVNVESIAAARPRFGDMLKEICRTVLHEAGHWLTFSTDETLSQCDEIPRIVSSFAHSQRFTPEYAAVLDSLSSLRWHGATWVRVLCHLANRADKAKGQFRFQCQPDDLGHHASYGLSRFRDYAKAHGGELDRFHDVPLRAVLATRAPEAFIQLAAADVLERSGGLER
jgi:hypothetical protein